MEALVIDWATRKLAMEDASVLRANLYSRLFNRAICEVYISDLRGGSTQHLVPDVRYERLVGWGIIQSFDHMTRFREHYEPVTPAVIAHLEQQLEQAKADEVKYSEVMKTSKSAIDYNTALASREHALKMQNIHTRHLQVMK